ncbi:shikimate kinase [Tumebacillus sp. BK434]|uniref:shikimate kinase n=1 Tax=Tumebacillus sp. BK434 TaxID=2512169 RepID=UPI00104E717A|nr:shikimate kinase [Tumebacillus sp. BK434]TCP59641.1 shikimate kinase [Tumebacillus sp. BK434]
MERRLYLIGFMGTGKTTIGHALAEELGADLYDTDAEIAQAQGLPIAELFAEQGEAHFRKLEHDMLSELSRRDPAVITTGGGAVLSAANRELMKASGMVVHLTASLDEIVRRVEQDANRPLLQGERPLRARVEELLAARAGLYDFANWTVDTTGRSIRSITAEIKQNLASSSR